MAVQVYHLGMGVCICRPELLEDPDVYLMKYSPETIDFVWPTVEPWLIKTLETAPPYWSIEDLLKKCKRGDLMLWVACVNKKPLGVLLTGIDEYEKSKACGVPWIGGSKMMIWIKVAQEIIEQWAKEAGCNYLVGSGRAGWGKIVQMQDYGPILIKGLL